MLGKSKNGNNVRKKRDPQAEAVFLRDSQHFPAEFFTWLGERDQAWKSDGPLIPPIEEFLKLQLGTDGRTND